MFKPFKVTLLPGIFYFAGTAIFHLCNWKLMPFYIFPDTISMAYQDKIIGVLALGWAFWAFQLYSSREPARWFILAGWFAWVYILLISFTPEVDSMTEGDTHPIYISLGLLCLYLLTLTISALKNKRW